MNVPQGPYPGAHVLVTWTDGRAYPATVTTVAQGFVQVQWDAGGAPAWAPLHVVRPLPVPAPSPPSKPTAQPLASPAPPASSGSPPLAPGGRPAEAKPASPVPAAAPGGAPAPSAPVGWNSSQEVRRQAADPSPAAQKKAAAPGGSPPRPTTGALRGLPRGLVYEPTAARAGAAGVFFFLFGFVATSDVDLAMRATDLDHIGDDVAALRAAGYRVIVDLHGDLETLNAALSGAHPDAGGAPTVGVYWSGHGDDDGTIATFEGDWIAPEQISPEAARLATVKLFIMSACHAGGHAPRWQKALGPQAQIIGWGAPITNQRAIEFLVPDDRNAKGFDDLLDKHLGARSVEADGPLHDVKELGQRHEERVATILFGVEQLVTEAAARLKVKVVKNAAGDVFFLELRTPPSKDAPRQGRSQLVRISATGAGDAWVHVSSLVGPHSDALDLARGIRLLSMAPGVRLAMTMIGDPESEFLVAEMLLRRRRLDPHSFAMNLMSVARYGDRLEDLFFGSDKR